MAAFIYKYKKIIQRLFSTVSSFVAIIVKLNLTIGWFNQYALFNIYQALLPGTR